MEFGISDAFFLEDVEDPVATNMFINSSILELMNDAEDKVFEQSSDEDECINTFFDDCMKGCSTSIIDTEVDKDIEIDNDIDDEDGEIIDITDGLI